MPGAVRVILEPIPKDDGSFTEVAQAKIKLVNRGPGTTLATTSPRPAELAFSLAVVDDPRSGSPAQATPIATLRGQLQLDEAGLAPSLARGGNDIVSLVAPPSDGSRQQSIALDLDPDSFGEDTTLVIPLPPPADDQASNQLELRVDLKIGGAAESLAGINDIFDFFRPKKQEIKLLKLISFSTLSDHQVLVDNDADLTPNGADIGQPEWQIFKGRAKPILHTKNQRISARIELEVHPPNADPVTCKLEGKGTFQPGNVTLTYTLSQSLGGQKDAKVTLQLSSTELLPDTLTKLTGDLKWTCDIPGKGVVTVDTGASSKGPGTSEGHVIYTTLGKSVDPPGSERRVTRKRVEISQQFVNDTGATDSQAIVKAWMKDKFPEYALEPSPKVPERLKHPTFFNDIGGAWHLLDHLDQSGECQAIVRVVRAMGNVLGMPGNYDAINATVDIDTLLAFEENGETGEGTKSQGTRDFSGRAGFAFLITNDPPPGPVGRIFEIGAPTSPSLNRFEACLKFTIPPASPGGQATTRFFPGGVGGAAFDDVGKVIRNSFRFLIFISDVPPATPKGPNRARIESIQALPLPQPGDLIP